MQLTDQPEPGVWAPISIHAPIKDATAKYSISGEEISIFRRLDIIKKM